MLLKTFVTLPRLTTPGSTRTGKRQSSNDWYQRKSITAGYEKRTTNHLRPVYWRADKDECRTTVCTVLWDKSVFTAGNHKNASPSFGQKLHARAPVYYLGSGKHVIYLPLFGIIFFHATKSCQIGSSFKFHDRKRPPLFPVRAHFSISPFLSLLG